MDSESSRHDALDQSAEPCHLPFQYLIRITNNFSREREIGRGGFGRVYKGVLSNGAMVAVKQLFSTMEIEEGKFENEVHNLLRVRHQNIVRFIGYSYETWRKHMEYHGRQIFVEMPQWSLCFEYVPNGSLKTYISDESRGLDWHEHYKIIKGICCGLYHLHEKCHIIHLDLKPANILLDENMVPKIADFGTSKILDDEKTHTHVTTPAGTLCYMAPEYLDKRIVTTKVDMYSLGVIMMEMLAGCKINAYDEGRSRVDFARVLGNWRNRLDASPSCTSLETDYQQIEICIQIGLSCVKYDPSERPEIKEIIERLNISDVTHCYVENEERSPADQILSLMKMDAIDLLQYPQGVLGGLQQPLFGAEVPAMTTNTKRARKLQEFVAHSSNVNCLKIGRKSSRVLVTGGQDHKVNLWAIGKPNSILSLSGHTSAVESVSFDSTEIFVAAGAASGTIKLWDLEERKIVRDLTGHRSNCTSVDFHPFGEFFASGSLDTNLKIWDIRRKGCIHTYKGHTRGVRTIRFTPDGRWVVSGGEDNTVKVWDLTAGKLLHDFKSHVGQIQCIDFHPLEFLLATGSADKTIKFWDLETFELIGSAGPETTGVRSMTFNPDGRSLLCGLHESLKVFSWEPIRCHDTVDVGWSRLDDLIVHEGKLLGCSFNQSCVGMWVVDLTVL